MSVPKPETNPRRQYPYAFRQPTINPRQTSKGNIREKKTKVIELTTEKETKNTVKFAEVQTQG